MFVLVHVAGVSGCRVQLGILGLDDLMAWSYDGLRVTGLALCRLKVVRLVLGHLSGLVYENVSLGLHKAKNPSLHTKRNQASFISGSEV